MPVDSLRSPSYTARWGDTPSIMDYARFNYVAQPGDGAALIPTISVYDSFAVNWGYRRIPGAQTPEAERPYLDSLARLQDANPMLRFGNLDGIDPNSQREAVGDDPVRATTFGLLNLKRVMRMLIPATTGNRLEDYSDLSEMYERVIGQWRFEMGDVLTMVGGVFRQEKYPSQAGVIHTPVPRAKQAEAVQFLAANVFKTPDFLLDPEILRRIEPAGVVERIRTEQTNVLRNLLDDARLSRLADQGATATAAAPAYTVADLVGDATARDLLRAGGAAGRDRRVPAEPAAGIRGADGHQGESPGRAGQDGPGRPGAPRLPSSAADAGRRARADPGGAEGPGRGVAAGAAQGVGPRDAGAHRGPAVQDRPHVEPEVAELPEGGRAIGPPPPARGRSSR